MIKAVRPSEEVARLKAISVDKTLRPWSAQDEAGQDGPTIIASSSGVYITDVDGHRMIDCVGGLWCVNTGYARTEIIEAITEQATNLGYASLMPGSANVPSIKLAELICELGKTEQTSKVFFGSNGSDAVENALKLARQYWKLAGRSEKYKIMSLRGAYHGTNFGGLSANGLDSAFRRTYEPLVPGFISVNAYDSYRPLIDGMTPESQIDLLFKLMDREIDYHSPETIAAFIAEPVQGGGGMHIPPESYWHRLRAMCDKHDILLISDEVVTGFGRTGCMFGMRGWGVKPDIMCLGKGISGGYAPLSATALSARVAGAWTRDSQHRFVGGGYTHSGNPIACAAGIAALSIVVRERLDINAGEVGRYFLEELRKLADRHEAIGDVRGKGLMICLEMVSDRKQKTPFEHAHPFPSAISKYCRDNGVWLRQTEHKFIISPPLIFSRADVDTVVSVLDQAFTSIRP